MPRGQVGEAVLEMRGVVESDPLSIFTRWWLALMLILDRQAEAAHEEARHMIDLDSGHFLGHWARGMAFDLEGRTKEAAANFEKSFELSGGNSLTMGLFGYSLGRAGRNKEARALLQQVTERARTGHVSPSVFAFIHIGLGERDRAFEWLDRMIELRDPYIMPIRTLHILDPLRGDPRFTALLEKMNLAGSAGESAG